MAVVNSHFALPRRRFAGWPPNLETIKRTKFTDRRAGRYGVDGLTGWAAVRRRSWPQAASMASPFLWRKRTERPWSSRMRRNVVWLLVLGVRYGRPETGLNGITFTSAVRR